MRSVFWLIKIPLLLMVIGLPSIALATNSLFTHSPTVFISSPHSNILIASEEQTTFSMVFNDDQEVDSGSVQITLNGDLINELCNVQASVAVCEINGLSAGIHNLHIEVMDYDGNLGVAEQSFLYLNPEHDSNIFLSKWTKGDGFPTNAFVRNSDLHLDSSNGDVFQNNDGDWGYFMNITGEVGLAGVKGEKGDKGMPGDQGLKGSVGDQGDIGMQGPVGLKGEQGEAGPQGIAGIKGEQGEIGEIGLTGLQGPKGEIGDEGKQGLHGPKGQKGDTGTSFYVAMSCPSGQALYGFDSVGSIACR